MSEEVRKGDRAQSVQTSTVVVASVGRFFDHLLSASCICVFLGLSLDYWGQCTDMSEEVRKGDRAQSVQTSTVVVASVGRFFGYLLSASCICVFLGLSLDYWGQCLLICLRK